MKEIGAKMKLKGARTKGLASLPDVYFNKEREMVKAITILARSTVQQQTYYIYRH